MLADIGEIVNTTGTTDQYGVITVTYRAPYGLVSSPKTVNFTVRYGGSTLSDSGTVTVMVGNLENVVITPNNGGSPYSMRAGTATVFSAQGFDEEGAPLPDNVVVDYSWSKSNGTGSGNFIGLTIQQDVTLIGVEDGSVSLQCIVETPANELSRFDVLGLNIQPAPPLSGIVIADPNPVTADPANVITFTVSALEDYYGNPAISGDAITLTLHSEPIKRVVKGTTVGQQMVVSVPATTQAGVYTISAQSAAG